MIVVILALSCHHFTPRQPRQTPDARIFQNLGPRRRFARFLAGREPSKLKNAVFGPNFAKNDL